ncbi:hypothetical protein N431DRAFT_362380 [Stipitochalara longipes BDJ]|nr:hypothetical protein N431DRAFT_362380 [Stipitochalara longipes BDJ]
MSSIKFTIELHAEPDTIQVPAEDSSKSEDDQRIKRFSIDFEALGEVLATEQGDGQDEPESEADVLAYKEIRKKECYAFSTTSVNHSSSQRVILYSPSFGPTIQASCFSELDIGWHDLPSIFSGESEHMWWMDVQNPSEKELRLLCSAFRIHPLTVEDILNREIQEKIEDFTHYYFASFRSYCVDETTPDRIYIPYTIYMVVFRTGTLSFCFDDSEHADHVLRRIELLKDYVVINSDWIFYAFVDDIVDSFNPSINQIEKKVNRIEDSVYTTRGEDKQAFIHLIEEVRKSISALLRLLGGKNNILLRFEKHHCSGEHEEEPSDAETHPGHDLRLYINDVKDHVTTMLGNLHQFESLLARSQNNYMAGLSIDRMQGSRRVNKFLNIMAVISMILTLMNIICALFSTNPNANVPMYANDTPAWYYIVGGEAALSLALFWLARRLKWC